MLVFLTLAHHVNRCAPFCYSSFSLTRQHVSVSSSHPLVQAASANPSFPFHPPYTYATSCSCHRSPCPIWQSQTEQQLTAHSFASFWFRLMPRAAGVRIIAHRSSVALLEWNEAEDDRACCGSCFPFQGCEFSFLVVMTGRRKEKNNTKTRSLISRSLFFHLVSCFLSLLLFPLPFLSWPFSIFFCCLVLRSKKTKRFHFIFFFSFSCFRLFFTRQCRKPSSADWSESGKLCHQAGLIFTSIRGVKTLPPQLRISDYQPSKMISWTEVILRSSSSISPLGLPAFYFRSLNSVWDRANVISLVPLPHPSCHFILDYISLSAFYTSFFFYQCSLFPVYYHLFQ